MAYVCIIKSKINKFKKAIKNKELDVFELMKMSTEERTAVFREFAGDNAKKMNTLFEEKLILKNRIQGIKNWINKVGEMGRYDPAKKAKLDALLSEYKARQQERMFNPKEEEGFLADLVEEKLGVRISKGEAKVAFDIQVKADNLFEKYNPTTETWSSEQSKAEYGATKQIYQKYLDNLKTDSLPVRGMLKSYSQEIKQLWKEDKYGATKKVIGDSVSTLSETMINAVSTWDNSFIGRQGFITLVKSPKTWWNMARKSFSDFYRTLKGQDPQDVLMAEIYADPDYINGNYEKAKLNFGLEEEVPIQLLEKIPVLGRLFKASNVSFIDSAIRARRDLFKIMRKMYEAKKIPLDDVNLKDIGTIVNTITARGKVGQIGTSAPVRLLLWAPRMLKADWDILTAHTLGFGLKTNRARLEAAKTTFTVGVMTAGLAAIANAISPGSVEIDPRSSDFLSIRKGNTRIKIPFARGAIQIVVLMARLLTQQTKSTQTGIITELNSGEYGSRTLFDVGLDFLTNKTTPPARAVISWLDGRDFSGKKPTLPSTSFGFLPISVQNFIQLKDDASAEAVFGAFADLFGFSAHTYQQETDWEQSTGEELQQFKDKIGEEKFKEANDLFNQKFNEWLSILKDDEKYQSLTNEEKREAVLKKKSDIKDSIFKRYNFKYKSKTTKKKLPKY